MKLRRGRRRGIDARIDRLREDVTWVGCLGGGGAKRNSPSLSVICLLGHLPISLNDLQPCSSMLVMLLIFTFFSLLMPF